MTTESPRTRAKKTLKELGIIGEAEFRIQGMNRADASKSGCILAGMKLHPDQASRLARWLEAARVYYGWKEEKPR